MLTNKMFNDFVHMLSDNFNSCENCFTPQHRFMYSDDGSYVLNAFGNIKSTSANYDIEITETKDDSHMISISYEYSDGELTEKSVFSTNIPEDADVSSIIAEVEEGILSVTMRRKV